MPRRAAGGGHEVLLGGNPHQEILRLLNGTHVRAHGDLHDPVEAQHLHGCGKLFRGGFLAELTDKSGSHDGGHLVALHDRADHLEDLALIHDGAEGTAHQALAAGNALVLVDHGLAVVIALDGIHAAGRHAGTLDIDDGVVWTRLGAFAAFDALIRIDLALAVDKRDRALGAYFLTGGGQTVLAELGDLVLLGRAGVAGIRDDIDEGRLVVGLGDGSLIHALGHKGAGLDGTDGQAHCQPHPLARNGPLQEDGFPVEGLVPGDDDVGQVLRLGVVAALIGHPGDLGEYLFADIGNQRWNAAHGVPPCDAFFCKLF